MDFSSPPSRSEVSGVSGVAPSPQQHQPYQPYPHNAYEMHNSPAYQQHEMDGMAPNMNSGPVYEMQGQNGWR